MAKIDSEIILAELRKWIKFRKDFQGRSYTPGQGDVREFVERCNQSAMNLKSVLDFPSDPELFEALGEAAFNAAAQMKQPGYLT